jgi:Cytochrome P460
MRFVLTCFSRIFVLVLVLSCSVQAQDIAVSEKDFTCIRDGHKIRNTFIRHPDPQKLKEAIRIFENRIPDTEYPVGTFLQLVPAEVMVKHPREKFPDTNGWEFFMLDLSGQEVKITSRGAKTVNFRGITCLSCHSPAKKFDFVCEKEHGCAPVSIDDKQIAEIQASDPRCPRK